MKSLGWRVVAIALAITWLFFVTMNYYIVHKPFHLSNALAIGEVILNCLVAVLIFALASGIGTRVLRQFTFASRLGAIVFRAGVGFAIVSFATFALGLAGLLQPILFWVLLLLALIFLRHDISENIHRPAVSAVCPTRWEKFLAGFVVLTFGLAFIVALTPPIEWDAQLYHLHQGKYALALGRIAEPPDIPTFNYPSLIEMLYLAALALKGDIVAKLLHWVFAVLVVGAVWDCGRRFWNTRVAWIAAATLTAIPTFATVMGWAYNDAALALYAFGAFYAVAIGHETKSTRWFVLAGVFAGCAMGTKNTALIIPVALALLIWRFNRQGFRHACMFSVVALAMALPWYLRNLVFVGNPIYPYFIGGKNWDAFRAAWGTRWGTGLLNEPLRLLFVPWEATILGQEGTELYAATLGPIMLAFIPLLLIVASTGEEKNSRRVLRDALIFSLMGYLFWLLGVAMSKLLLQSRYLIPIFTTLALAVGVVVERLRSLDLRAFSLARFSKMLFGLMLGLTLGAQALELIALNPAPALAGFEARDQYLARRLSPRGYFDAMQAIRELPPQHRILFLWETRSYYAPYPLTAQPDQLLDAWADLVYRFHNADGIADYLRREGFTHVLLSRTGLDFILQSGYDPITQTDLAVLEDFAARYLNPVIGTTTLQIDVRNGKPGVRDAERDPYIVYEILPSSR